MTSETSTPTPGELEVSLFGPGYGESVVLHLGNAQWVVVDSCLEPVSGVPAPLRYLDSLGVDVERAVKLIVATHWHDDHVRGLSAILGKCKSAKLAVSGALNSPEFLKLASLYSRNFEDRTSGISEFAQVFRILQERKERGSLLNPPTFASQDKLLFHHTIPSPTSTVVASVYSLSPSDAATLQAQMALAQLVPTEKQRQKRVAEPSPNEVSVVIWVEVGGHRVLLGADLERSSNPRSGWAAVLDDSNVVSGKASAFKIPHHGAESSHDPRVWSELLFPNPFALLSPYCLMDKVLPTSADIGRVSKLTRNAYLTAPAARRRHRYTNSVVRDVLRETTKSIWNTQCGWGQVRLRCDISDKSAQWRVELFGDAYALNANSSPVQWP